jgi:hypothetical protein
VLFIALFVMAIVLLSRVSISQVLLISPQYTAQPQLAPHDCQCKPVCKCNPCVCNLQTKPVVSVKKITTPNEASYIIRNVIGKDTYQASCTAIDERTVVSCWHILRSGTGTLTVNGMPAKVLKVDSKSDVALLAVDGLLKHVPVANEPLKAGEPCVAMGYEYDKKGKLWQFPSRILRLNRYAGFPNQSILGRPKSGRSGGGLFNAAGELVGVCSAADGQEGLYAGHAAIVSLLNFPSGKTPTVKQSLTVPTPSKSTGLKPNLAGKTTPFLLQDCPDGTCPLIPKQAPATKGAAVSGSGSFAPVSPSRACPTCPSLRQSNPQTTAPSFPPYSRTRGFFWRGRR